MVLLSAMAIGAAAYVVSQRDQEPAFDIEDKTSIDLLPSETALSFFEPPISSITFLEGNAENVAVYLRQRINEIVKANPWLGGWLHRTGGVMRLWFDEKAKDLAPNLFCNFKAGDIDLSRDTPYKEYENLFAAKEVKVKKNADLMGQNEPVWRVSLVPDGKDPEKRFAVITSMSHVCGDIHTHYQINNMLNAETQILALNAERKKQFADAAKETMGEKEAQYIQNATYDPLFKDLKIGTARNHIFYISDDWLRSQKLLWSGKLNTKMQSWLQKARSEKVEAAAESCCWGFMPPRSKEPAVVDDASEAAPSLFRGRLREVSVKPSNNDILVSWFWRTVDASIGLMVFNFRNRLIDLTDNDAGNYVAGVPYTPEDYKTPQLIQKSLHNARRVGADKVWKPTKLPKFTLTSTFSVNTNWSTFGRKDLTLDGSCKQVVHLPLFFAKDLKVFPSTMSFMVIFNAGPGEKLAALVLAPESLMEKVDSSGVVGETIAKF